MKNLNLRGRRGELPEKEEAILISKEKVRRLCKSNYHGPSGSIVNHKKEVFSDGWTRWVCLMCGQVKFSIGMTFKEGM